MKRLFTLFLGLALACRSNRNDSADDRGHGHGHDTLGERPALSFTQWSDTSELFLELPALVRAQESPCAAHVTKLAGFEPVATGRITVILRGGAKDERFESQGPNVPGIFRPIVKPMTAGKRSVVVEIRTPELSVDHELGEVTVFDNHAAARAAMPKESPGVGRITFLKEQQWPIDFGTAKVAERAIRSTLRATGSIRARSDGEVNVSAPVAGRVASTGRGFPRLGARVTVNDALGVLAPRLEAADLASLELDVTSAILEQRYAERERQRLEGLQAEGAVPERRVLDAVHAHEAAQASLGAAQRRLDQFRVVQRTSGRGEGAVQLRAPLSGTITAVHAAPGGFVESGAALFRVTDLTQLWLEARIAEMDVARLGTPRGASFVVDGTDGPIELPAESMVARGHVIDPVTKTLPLLFSVDNADGRLSPGAFARVLVVTGDEHNALGVPESSLVDDSGAFVVFIQVEGEAFERRVVRVGARDRGYAEVLSGIRAGERVVTRGAWSVKLAASSGSIPAHGHAH